MVEEVSTTFWVVIGVIFIAFMVFVAVTLTGRLAQLSVVSCSPHPDTYTGIPIGQASTHEARAHLESKCGEYFCKRDQNYDTCIDSETGLCCPTESADSLAGAVAIGNQCCACNDKNENNYESSTSNTRGIRCGWDLGSNQARLCNYNTETEAEDPCLSADSKTCCTLPSQPLGDACCRL